MLRAYDYRCPKGHVTEVFLKEAPKTHPCGHKGCKKEGEYSPSFWYTSSAPGSTAQRVSVAQGFQPVAIYRNNEGVLCPLGSPTSEPPKGLEKIMVNDIHHLRKVEKEMQRHDESLASKFRSARQTLTDGQLKENRRVMEGLVKNFSSRGKRFYDAMRKVSEARQRRGPAPTDPRSYFEAYTQNSSNRDAYYDEHNQHGSGNRGK